MRSHIVGVPVKENCKTGLSKQVGKTSIFTKESLVIIQDKMREKCIEEFNNIYELDSKLKEKQKGKNKDYTPYERLMFNEKANELKQELNNLRNEVSDLEDNKKSISKEIIEYSCAGVPLFRRNGYRQSSGRKPLIRNRDTTLN